MDKAKMLDELKNHLKITKNSDFARFLGISSQAVSNWYSRNTFDAELLYTKCVGVNAEWLLSGKGKMMKTKTETLAEYQTENMDLGIPLIPISAMAGAFAGEIQVLRQECEHYYIPSFKGADFLIPVKGSSMVPTYDSGDVVACKMLNLENIFFQWNKVYVLDTDQGALIKRVKPGNDEKHITIISDNPAYPPFQLPLKDVYSVALVVGVIRLE